MENEHSADKLLHVDWGSESERTRMTQALEEHQDMLERPGSTVRYVNTSKGDYEQMLDDLVQGVSSDNISAYDLSEDEQLETTEIVFEYEFGEIPDDVEIEDLATYVITEKGGRQVDPVSSTHEVSRNGHAYIDYEVGDSSLTFEIEGHGAVVESYREDLEETLQQVEEDLF